MRIQIRVLLAGIGVLSATLVLFAVAQNTVSSSNTAPPAPAGFDNKTNGFVSQTMFDADREVFEEQEEIDEGLGPVFNALGCGDCHGNPVVGGSSQVTELRAGHWDGSQFVEHPGGSLINDRAISPGIQERLFPGNEVRAERLSLNILGDGFVEAIDDSTFSAIANSQPSSMRGHGTFIVPSVLGSKTIHPFSDFMLHDIGTGDGIVQNGGGSSRNEVRTAPLWGLRTRGRLMHDGATFTISEAISRHRGEAASISSQFQSLSSTERRQLLTYLNSL